MRLLKRLSIFLTKDEIRQWEKKRAPYNKMRNNALFHLLESGHNGNLPCPLCSNKMKELSLSYVKSMVASSNEEMVKDPAQYAIAIVFEMIPIIGDIISLANAVGRTGHESMLVGVEHGLPEISHLIIPGVGSFGLECLSRGAKKVTFVENYSKVLLILTPLVLAKLRKPLF